MFAHSNTLARGYTRPIVTSRCDHQGKLSSGIGSYVVLNPDGWIITAFHNIQALTSLAASRTAFAEHEAKVKAIQEDAAIPVNRKKREIQKLGSDNAWTRSFAIWWGYEGIASLDGIVALPEVDLAIGRLKDFDPGWVSVYPKFLHPNRQALPGTSLCRLGFPFHEIVPEYDPVLDAFTLPANSVPPPFFPMEGILTRNLYAGDSPGGYRLLMVETSSPGLKGQSGGPIFDTSGVIWGIQTRTQHFQLGFEAVVEVGGKRLIEHQFLNSGLGAHSHTIVPFLQQHGIQFELADP